MAMLKANFPNMESSTITESLDKNRRRYVIESIFSGIDSFASITHSYHCFTGHTASKVGGATISLETLQQQFVSMFNEFNTETKFQNKCRLLLDLFKLQIIFAGMIYD
jgi:hypothetical protein